MNIRADWCIVVEPNEVMRRGLINLINESGSLNCVGFDSIDMMEKGFNSDMSDALLLANIGHDENLMTQGLSRLKSSCPACRIVVLSKEYSHSHLHIAINEGACGYLLTGKNCETLVKSLELIALGQPVIPQEAIELITNGHANREARQSRLPDGLLSDRETVVLSGIRRAMSNKQIARECHVCEATVKTHVKAILRKIHRQNRTDAAIWAFEHGVEPGEHRRITSTVR